MSPARHVISNFRYRATHFDHWPILYRMLSLTFQHVHFMTSLPQYVNRGSDSMGGYIRYRLSIYTDPSCFTRGFVSLVPLHQIETSVLHRSVSSKVSGPNTRIPDHLVKFQIS